LTLWWLKATPSIRWKLLFFYFSCVISQTPPTLTKFV
jgi:hypothetical protein